MEDLVNATADMGYVNMLTSCNPTLSFPTVADYDNWKKKFPDMPEAYDLVSYVHSAGITFATGLADPLALHFLQEYLTRVKPDDVQLAKFLGDSTDPLVKQSKIAAKNLLDSYPDLQSGEAYDKVMETIKNAKSKGDNVLEPMTTAFVEQLKTEHAANFMASDECKSYVETHWGAHLATKSSIEDFEMLRPLGKGAFGLVS